MLNTPGINANPEPMGRWLTTPEIMGYLKIKSRQTLSKWVKLGHIHAHKRTGVWIYDRISADKWLESETY